MGEPANTPVVLATVQDGIGVLTLNRPAALNALSLDMVRGLQQALSRWATDDAVRAVVFRGAGEKGFCAGGDIRSLHDSFKAGTDAHMTFFEEEYALDLAIHRYPKPTVALMDGYTMGGGMGIAQGTAVRIVTERTRIAMPEVGIGYFPDVGGTWFLSRLPGAVGLYLGLTGVQIQAADALYCGLADLQMPSAGLADAAAALAQADWTQPSVEAARTALGLTAPDPTQAPLAALREAIDLHFGAPDVPAILRSLASETRPAFADWAAKTLATMQARSPLAMCVTLEALRRGALLTLPECLQMEYALDRQWFPRGDIVEGVRALIVDKDKRPRWTPATLAEVDEALVQSFFVDEETPPMLAAAGAADGH